MNIVSFRNKLKEHNLNIKRNQIHTLQINVGKLCNQACSHCHVEAGPLRTEIMEKKTFEQVLKLIDHSPLVKTVDLTGGAPELNQHFRFFVQELFKRNIEVLDRCNLTVLYENGQEDLPEFLREFRVHIIASLPCYSKNNVDKQRGGGVFDKSIKALQKFNSLGYGKEHKLKLDLVYNPLGASLPPSQEKLESDYKHELKDLFGIEFNSLFTITNMPIKRFEYHLKKQEKLDEYMNLLFQNFNPRASQNVMCKDLVSISWDGKIYDCDFNQMLELPCKSQESIWKINSFENFEEEIIFANHCYGCTAGAGSSCTGSLT